MKSSLSFKSWMSLIEQNTWSDRDEKLFKQGLQEHPEWVRYKKKRWRPL